MLSFIKPTKFKLGIFVVVLITLWSSIKLQEIISPIAFDYLFSEAANSMEDAQKENEEFSNIRDEMAIIIGSTPRLFEKVALHSLIVFVSLAIPCYLCSCIFISLAKNRLVKSIPNNAVNST